VRFAFFLRQHHTRDIMTGVKPEVIQKQHRDESSRLDVIIVGAGLGGLGAAISILLVGHNVHILESTPEIGEIGAGIQCLPNSSRVLISWGLEEYLSKHATSPRLQHDRLEGQQDKRYGFP